MLLTTILTDDIILGCVWGVIHGRGTAKSKGTGLAGTI